MKKDAGQFFTRSPKYWSKGIHIVARKHGENISVVSYGNVLGTAVPAVSLFKGKRMKYDWVNNFPPGSLCQITPVANIPFIDWVNHFPKYKVDGSV